MHEMIGMSATRGARCPGACLGRAALKRSLRCGVESVTGASNYIFTSTTHAHSLTSQ